jgi:Icc-related predicted phosphoesterase
LIDETPIALLLTVKFHSATFPISAMSSSAQQSNKSDNDSASNYYSYLSSMNQLVKHDRDDHKIRTDIQSNDPTALWRSTQNTQTVKKLLQSDLLLGPADLSTPLAPLEQRDFVRIVCISDTHGFHEFKGGLPRADILLHAGDFSFRGLPDEISRFNSFLRGLTTAHKIIIAGNHDLSFDRYNYSRHWRRFGHEKQHNREEMIANLLENVSGGHYLEDEAIQLFGYKFYGSPWQPEFCDWAFNETRGSHIRQHWKKIPSDTEVLITHGPALGHSDRCRSGQLAGCYDLLMQIQQRIRCKYHISGHIHESYGITADQNNTVYINASSCNYDYDKNKLNPPVVFDLPKKSTSQNNDTDKIKEKANNTS